MRHSLLLAAAASGALASLNCTATASVKTYCCPDTNSEVVKTGPAGALLMLGCAADNTNKNWYWNYNGLYTPYSTQFKDCYLNTIPFNDLKVLPDCKDDTYVLDLTRGKSGPLDKCNPNCVTQNKYPANTYFGDRQKETNMAADFPRPGGGGGGGGGGWPGWPWSGKQRRAGFQG